MRGWISEEGELTLSSGSVARGESWVTDIEYSGYVDVVPFFLGKGMGTI
jgi:hypothetical protein